MNPYRDKDDWIAFIVVTGLALVGFITPIILLFAEMYCLLIVFVIVYWFVPGLPVPLVHVFCSGWMPFIEAYIFTLANFFDPPIHCEAESCEKAKPS